MVSASKLFKEVGMMKRFYLTGIVVLWIFAPVVLAVAGETPISDATQECLDCHSEFHPGIVQDWNNKVAPFVLVLVSLIRPLFDCRNS